MSVGQVLAPSVELKWAGKTVSTDSMKMRIAVGQDPTVSVSAFSGPDAARSSQPALSAEAASMMGQAQQTAAQGEPKKDFDMLVKDGAGTSLRFRGIVAGPTYQMDSQGKAIRPAIAAISESGLVANLKLSIYVGADKDPTAPLEKRNILLGSRTDSPNLAQRMLDLTDAMIEMWLRYRISSTDRISERIKGNVHLANESGPLEIWRTILTNSLETLNLEWLSSMKDSPTINLIFNNELLGMLRSPTGSFRDTISRICSAFNLQYVPLPDGSPGRLEPREKRVTGDIVQKIIPATSVFMGGELPQSLLPVQQVLIMGKVRSGILEAGVQTKDGEGLLSVAGYPQNATTANGNILTIPLPFYLEFYQMVTRSGQSTRKSPPIDYAPKAFRKLRDITQTHLSAREAGLMNSFAKSMYNDAALSNYSAQIFVPLNLTWQVGRRHELSTGGTPLFRGFLNSVEHTVSRGEMGTSLDFTHVEYGSYRLPT